MFTKNPIRSFLEQLIEKTLKANVFEAVLTAEL